MDTRISFYIRFSGNSEQYCVLCSSSANKTIWNFFDIVVSFRSAIIWKWCCSSLSFKIQILRIEYSIFLIFFLNLPFRFSLIFLQTVIIVSWPVELPVQIRSIHFCSIKIAVNINSSVWAKNRIEPFLS